MFAGTSGIGQNRPPISHKQWEGDRGRQTGWGVGWVGGGGGHPANEGMPEGNRLCAMKHAEDNQIAECCAPTRGCSYKRQQQQGWSPADVRQNVGSLPEAVVMRQAVANLPE